MYLDSLHSAPVMLATAVPLTTPTAPVNTTLRATQWRKHVSVWRVGHVAILSVAEIFRQKNLLCRKTRKSRSFILQFLFYLFGN